MIAEIMTPAELISAVSCHVCFGPPADPNKPTPAWVQPKSCLESKLFCFIPRIRSIRYRHTIL